MLLVAAKAAQEPFLWLVGADYARSDVLYFSYHSCAVRHVAGTIAIG
jgi:hypothetical protein